MACESLCTKVVTKLLCCVYIHMKCAVLGVVYRDVKLYPSLYIKIFSYYSHIFKQNKTKLLLTMNKDYQS